jgi:NAD(P)-dependent dehydrogenase (short-subunit alcohol dehydrogenase family)
VRTETYDQSFGERFAGYEADAPLGRLCAPDDVAGACLMLASPLTQFVSGACLVLHGGGEKAMATTPPARSQ